MKIIADKNIIFAKEVFSTLGDVVLLEQKELTNKNIRDFDILLVRSTTKINESLLANTKIKFVASAVSGDDHIDKEYLQKAEIAFFTAAGCNAQSVVEYVITAIYSFCKQEFSLPQNKTVGIIGVGNIGSLLAEILGKLGIKTILNDPIRENSQCEQHNKDKFSDLDYLVQNSDIISVHVPLTKEGKHKTLNLLSDNFFSQLKENTILIQTSRGDVIDEIALLKYINKISPPVIDVWANEPNINIDLVQKTFFATPHIAGHSLDGKIAGTKMIYEATCKYLNKRPTFDFEKEIYTKIESVEVDFNTNIAEILQKSCPIANNSSDLREILGEKKIDKRKDIFKNLRQNYTKRLEFKHFFVKNTPKEMAEELSILGLKT